MRDVLDQVVSWYLTGDTFALATVVKTSGSAPRQPGATMAVSGDGEVVGSVSGGCVEGAIYESAQQAIKTGQPMLDTYGISDNDAFATGLTCGGEIQVFVQPMSRQSFPAFTEVVASVRAHHPVALATAIAVAPAIVGADSAGAQRVIWPDRALGSLGSSGLDRAVDSDARGLLAQGVTGQCTYGQQGERRRDEVAVFVRSFAPPPRMLVFGAIDFAAAVSRVGKFLGYHVTVCDARGIFATRQRFPDADEVIVNWPHRYLAETVVDSRTAICVLTHDPKFDIPLLTAALRTPAGYVGALGSRRTHDDRIRRLREIGVTEEELQRLHSPIGLDIGARTPEETAISIAAELTQMRWGGTGRPLSVTAGPIHH
ncbi:XdhC family protein [Actinopolymorpha alba]|uniref:XdhC family protein n=1 Tax=Actinopolymorpha alba TaxID=533267 RepID=UPI00035F7A3B|nr:XdhC family protein [Actinopolymorpha alba]